MYAVENIAFELKDVISMTNFEYIMKNMTERDVAAFLWDNCFSTTELADKAYDAFQNWCDSLCTYTGSKYYLDDETKRPNPFTTSMYRYFKNGKCVGTSKELPNIASPRKTELAIQVWLTKQYDPKEWQS